MDDAEWSQLNHPWERLRWARLHWQRERGAATTMRAAAETLGIPEGTYSGYERAPGTESAQKKNIPFDHNLAIKFGEKFKVSWVWLLTGDETPFSRSSWQLKAVGLLAGMSEDAQAEAVDIMETVMRRRLAS